MKKSIITLLLAIALLAGCSEKIVYVNNYIRPEIPQMQTLARPDLGKIKFDILTQNELQYYCTSVNGVEIIRTNQWGLQDSIKSYEKMIKVYDNFYRDYEAKRNAPPTEE